MEQLSGAEVTAGDVSVRRLLGESGADLDAYLDAGGYATVRGTGVRLADLQAEVEAAGLVGRGGGGFPLARKLAVARTRPGPRIVVMNGAEDEPGSRKDRELMRTQPHLVLDGALTAAKLLEASDVVLYVNAASPECSRALFDAAAAAGARVDVGDIRVMVAEAPAYYVAGEETAAVQFLERGEARPRIKPPYPAENGISGMPTLVSNVETLAHLALIARHGAAWFRSVGTDGLPGTVLVTVPDAFARPGVYEVPGGTWLDELLDGTAGGPAGTAVRGVQVGGPAAGWLTAADLHVRLEPAALAERGTSLGCGAIRVLTEDRCAVDAVAETSMFFARESCGQCPPCRMATGYVSQVVTALGQGGGVTDAHLDQAAMSIEGVSERTACALSGFPGTPFVTARERFADDFAAHLRGEDCGRAHPVLRPVATPV